MYSSVGLTHDRLPDFHIVSTHSDTAQTPFRRYVEHLLTQKNVVQNPYEGLDWLCVAQRERSALNDAEQF